MDIDVFLCFACPEVNGLRGRCSQMHSFLLIMFMMQDILYHTIPYHLAGISGSNMGRHLQEQLQETQPRNSQSANCHPTVTRKKNQLAAAIASARRQGHTVLCGQSFS